MSVKDALKGARVLSYQRVSTTKQEGTLPTQEKANKASLKSLGFKGQPELFSEQISGTKLDRKELNAMIKRALELKKQGKKVVIALRDFQRFSRNAYDIGILYKNTPSFEESLWFNDIPLVSLNENIVTGTRTKANPNGDLLGPLLVVIGGQEIEIRKDQSERGLEQAADEGIIAGTGVNLYSKEKLNPLRELRRMLEAGISQSEASRRLGRSKSWAKDNKRRLADLALKGVLDDWLDTTDIIREFEQEFGPRQGPQATKRMLAVGRKTSGYLKFPEKYRKPEKEDIQFYFDNFKMFQKKR
jgi:DNA invertase Pin-like site-specific DNA recombinase